MKLTRTLNYLLFVCLFVCFKSKTTSSEGRGVVLTLKGKDMRGGEGKEKRGGGCVCVCVCVCVQRRPIQTDNTKRLEIVCSTRHDKESNKLEDICQPTSSRPPASLLYYIIQFKGSSHKKYFLRKKKKITQYQKVVSIMVNSE